MAIIICPNCGNEISDEMDFCPHCKTPMSVILSQKPKKKRITPVLVPVLSVLNGLVLLGTVGLLTWGVMNPAVISPTAMESAVTSTDPGTACSIISTLQGNAAKNYNKYHHDVPSAQSEPLTPITEVSQDVGTIEPEAGQVTPLSGESAESPEQNSTPQQDAQPPAPAPDTETTPQENSQIPVDERPQSQSTSSTTNTSSNANIPQSARNLSADTIVYVSNRSNTIHRISDCSNMKYYREMTIEAANSNSYEYCENCW